MNSDFSTYLTKRNIIGLIGLVVIFVTIPIGLYLTSTNQNPFSKAAPNDYIEALSLSSNNVNATTSSPTVELQVTLPPLDGAGQAPGQPGETESTASCLVTVNKGSDSAGAIRYFKAEYINNGSSVSQSQYSVQFRPYSNQSLYTCNNSNPSDNYIPAEEFNNGEGWLHIYATAQGIQNGDQTPEINIKTNTGEIISCDEPVVNVENVSNCNGEERGKGCPCYHTSSQGACLVGRDKNQGQNKDAVCDSPLTCNETSMKCVCPEGVICN